MEATPTFLTQGAVQKHLLLLTVHVLSPQKSILNQGDPKVLYFLH